jgi:hypothetical protein
MTKMQQELQEEEEEVEVDIDSKVVVCYQLVINKSDYFLLQIYIALLNCARLLLLERNDWKRSLKE